MCKGPIDNAGTYAAEFIFFLRAGGRCTNYCAGLLPLMCKEPIDKVGTYAADLILGLLVE